ncbi:dihydrofolate reductase family protein [Nesterenkonia haasae]|uniref:dihydrofolate reductase family protein n=1 Tax=Nesterenkonia haasae TaxID=2587813 RepID=UPI001390EC92|nr:dihydrofolate reductase family protein [Nesterenkonia haasae]NDK30235.1 dihydrofolate reductase [Nesterenkonia haasae]
MSNVIADISMSLDGFVTGPDPDLEHGLGRGGEAVQQWVFASNESPEDRAFLEQAEGSTGAVIMGRRTFDFVDGPNGWNQDINYAYDHPTTAMPPIFVLTHHVPSQTRHTQGFTFIRDGIESAVSQAREAAVEKEVVIMGGGETIARAIAAGLVDMVRVHLSPVLMGAGTSLFALIDQQIQMTQVDVVVTPNATHLTYQIETTRKT